MAPSRDYAVPTATTTTTTAAAAASVALPAVAAPAPPRVPAEYVPVVRFAADFLASWHSFATTLILAHPVDTLRVRLQTQGQRPLQVIRADGVRALYAGFFTPMLANGPIVGMVFATNEIYRPMVRRAWSGTGTPATTGPEGFTTAELAAAGFLTGFTCSVLQCPANSVRIHQQLATQSGGLPLSVWESAAMLRAEARGSWRGIFRALPSEAVADGIGRMFYFSIYRVLRTATRSTFGDDRADSLPVNLALGAATAVLGWVVNFPVDAVKTRLQGDAIVVGPAASVSPALAAVLRGPAPAAYLRARAGGRRYRGFWHCTAVVYREAGLRGFYKGFALTSLRCSLSAGFSLPLFDLAKPVYRSAFRVDE